MRLSSKKEQDGLLNFKTALGNLRLFDKTVKSLCIVAAFEFPTYNFNQRNRTLKDARAGGCRCFDAQ